MTYVVDPMTTSRVYRRVPRLVTLLLCAAIAACGGGSKKDKTTPTAGSGQTTGGGQDGQSMNDTGDPTMGQGGGTGGGGTGGGGGTVGNDGGGAGSSDAAEVPVTFPNYDPDPQAAKSQVDQQLALAKQALSSPTPDGDAALRAAREALKIDATSVEAAAYVAFAYYHKKQYDTAELVLDELIKRPSAKDKNATMYYVYGLVYDKTNRPEVAVKAYEKAVELDANFASALVNLGAHQLRNKQYDRAQSTFERLTKEMNRTDAVTLTSLGSAYRGRSGDYPPGSGDRNQLIMQSEAAYKRALSVNPNYGPAYFNLALLYLDADPFPSGGGQLDTLQRLNAAKAFLDQYKNAPGVDIALYDERYKDVDKAIKREEKRRKKAAKSGGNP